MAMTITPQDETEFETAGRRRKITKFALVGVAVLGVGVALTSAARITIDDFEDVAPGLSVSKEVWVENIGSTDLALTLETEASGPMFATATNADGVSGAATVAAVLNDPADAVLEVGEIAEIMVTVTGWEYWPQNFQGRNGSVVVNVQGTIGLD